MQIVIDMSEEDYNEIEPFLNGQKIKGGFNIFKLLEMIKNGTPLPKGHGRLIDADKLIRDTIKNPVHAPYIHIIDMKEAPTIIEGSEANDS